MPPSHECEDADCGLPLTLSYLEPPGIEGYPLALRIQFRPPGIEGHPLALRVLGYPWHWGSSFVPLALRDVAGVLRAGGGPLGKRN